MCIDGRCRRPQSIIRGQEGDESNQATRQENVEVLKSRPYTCTAVLSPTAQAARPQCTSIYSLHNKLRQVMAGVGLRAQSIAACSVLLLDSNPICYHGNRLLLPAFQIYVLSPTIFNDRRGRQFMGTEKCGYIFVSSHIAKARKYWCVCCGCQDIMQDLQNRQQDCVGERGNRRTFTP